MTSRNALATRALAYLSAAVGCLLLFASSAHADFDITHFDGQALEQDGSASVQAGAHPYQLTTEFSISSHLVEGVLTPDENPQDIEVRLPPGLMGNPLATPTCTFEQLEAYSGPPPFNECPVESQVGFAELGFTTGGPTTNPLKLPVYNIQPPLGKPALFGIMVINMPIYLDVKIRSGEDYGVTSGTFSASQASPYVDAKFTLWGVPADPAHDPERGEVCFEGFCLGGGHSVSSVPRPFLTNPMNCSAGPLPWSLRISAWQNQGVFEEDGFLSHLTDGTPAGVTGCDRLPFEPSITVQPTSRDGDSPSGLSVELEIPQNEAVKGLAAAYLKKATVALPEGVSVNPAAGDGLAGCAPGEVNLASPAPAQCPDSSKIGSVEVVTPVLDHPVKGSVYAASPGDNPFDSLLAMYIALNDPRSGIVVKLPARVEADPRTGRLTATVDDSPQLPFSEFKLDFFGGPRAPLRLPRSCGTYTTTGTFSSWAAADPSNPAPAEIVTSVSRFEIDRGPGGGPCADGGFSPKLEAGTGNPVAGVYSPMSLRVTREDGGQEIASLSLALPRGLLGKLAGIPFCAESRIEQAIARGDEGGGALEAASPSCPPDSQIGTVTVGAGAGPSPLYIQTGRVYLAGPYKGAPLSLVVITPAIAGPFDLGAVVVRTALRLHPATAQITAVSDPIPTILDGIPLALRDLRVNVNRSRFVLNPTSCAEKEISGFATAPSGAVGQLKERFQVGSCEKLGFRPRLSLKLRGGSKRGDNPALVSTFAPRPGNANLKALALRLPRSAFLDQDHIRTICTRVQFAADACPKGAIYGTAKAWTPLLDKPLAGPVYLRSSDNELPDLVLDLHGLVDVEAVARIDSKRRAIRASFTGLPDAPLTKVLVSMRGGGRGLIVNSRDLCAGAVRATAELAAHNGKRRVARPKVVASGCGKR
jgi:hypothetical protein